MQVFIADIDSISKNADDYVALLSAGDRVRVAKFQKKTRKLQFILGHLMVAAVGKKYTSIAHRDNLVVVATASNARVGVDIENASVQRDFVGAAELMGAKTPKTLHDFYKMFTKSEATYKLGTKPACTHFITYGNYLICVVANKDFATPRVHNFDALSILAAKKE
jgi:hypothetical protein